MSNQKVIWEGTIVGADKIADFESWLASEGFKCAYLEEYETLPDSDDPENTGGRNDVMFEVDAEDVDRFAMWRMGYGMRWWEDVVRNQKANRNVIIPDEVLERHPATW